MALSLTSRRIEEMLARSSVNHVRSWFRKSILGSPDGWKDGWSWVEGLSRSPSWNQAGNLHHVAWEAVVSLGETHPELGLLDEGRDTVALAAVGRLLIHDYTKFDRARPELLLSLQTLLQRPAMGEATNRLLAVSISAQCWGMVEPLLLAEVDPNGSSEISGWTRIQHAVHQGLVYDVQSVGLWETSGANFEAVDLDGRNLLHLALDCNLPEISKLEAVLSVDSRVPTEYWFQENANGVTPADGWFTWMSLSPFSSWMGSEVLARALTDRLNGMAVARDLEKAVGSAAVRPRFRL